MDEKCTTPTSNGGTDSTKYLRSLLKELLEAMIVRQSPSPKKNTVRSSWPPKSPHDALLSSPSGRKKVQRLYSRSSTSPSPVQRKQSAKSIENEQFDDSDDEEDEETLQLKLKAIEARLKLKKIQKSKLTGSGVEWEKDRRKLSRVGQQSTSSQQAPEKVVVQVPLSPTRPMHAPSSPKSPGRVLLGIDKGLKAAEVSLKKPPTRRYTQSMSDRQELKERQNPKAKTRSFNERISDLRDQETLRQKKEDKAAQSRSKGFGVEICRGGAHVASEHHSTEKARDRIVKKDTRRSIANDKSISSASRWRGAQLGTGLDSEPEPDSQAVLDDPTLHDNYSTFRLSKRTLATDALDGALQNKSFFSIAKLLKVVVGPNFEAPDIEGDYVVFGIIAKKSSPYDKAAKHHVNSTAESNQNTFGDRTKFMVLHLTDLKWEIDLFLFDTGFERFWKLTVGTVVAILNPWIMPPKPHMRDTGKFSLKLSSSDDTVLEIGSARDLGFCKSVKRDGQQCSQWIDQRHTEFCEFHVNLKVEKARAGRMEVNTMTDLYTDLPADKARARAKGRDGRFVGQKIKGGRSSRGLKDDGLTREGRHYDSFLNETVYLVPPGSGASAAKLFDDEDLVDRGMSRTERQRKRLAAIEKERGLAQKLGVRGDGLGAAYIRMKHSDSSQPSRSTPEGEIEQSEQGEPADATSLGLMGNNASASRLSPVRGRRLTTISSTDALGWSLAFKKGIPTSKRDGISPSKGTPSTKRARFMIEEIGIRIPGRDSLPSKDADDDDDDEDGLDIF